MAVVVEGHKGGVMKLLFSCFALLLLLNGVASAQGCPNGIPSANNPGCIPPDDSLSPYYEGSSGLQSVSPAARPSGSWQKTWGAIATSLSGGALGVVTGALSKQEAEQRAFADCKAKGGGGCQVDLTYRNQCAAMVVGKVEVKLAGAPTIQEATQISMKACQDLDRGCRVYYTACTEPIFLRY